MTTRRWITPFAEVAFLREEVKRLENDKSELVKIACEAANIFLEYAEIHNNKRNFDKAETNRKRAVTILEGVQALKGEPLPAEKALTEIVKLFDFTDGNSVIWKEIKKILDKHNLYKD